MDAIWLAAPSPALWLGREPGAAGWRINPAAQAWADRCGLHPPQVWPLVADHCRRALPAATAGRLAAPALRWQAVAQPDGWLVWITPLEAVAADPPVLSWRSADDQLALVRAFVAIGVFERDLHTLEARWDAGMFRLFGLTPGLHPPAMEQALERVHADDRERFRHEHERFVREGGRHDLRYRVVWPDGSRHDLKSLVEVRQAADGTPLTMIGVIVDDTEGAGRVRAERANTLYLAQAVQLAEISVWRIDLDARRIHVNDIGCEMLGIAPPEDGLDLDRLRSRIHPDDESRVREAATQAIESGRVVDLEARYADASGRYRSLLTRRVAERDESGRVIGLLGISLDQSTQVEERARVRALMRRIEVVSDAANLGIWSIDDESGAVEWNAEMFRIYGVGREALPATLVDWSARFMHPDDLEPMALTRHEAVRSGARAFESEFRIVRPDGAVRWVTSRSRLEEHGGRLLLIGVQLDTTELVTQRQRVDEALREKEAALQANRAKTAFLARASHELRTPLNAVLGFAQLIEHDVDSALPAPQLERVARIRKAGEHLLTLVDDVLDMAAIEAGSLAVLLVPVSIDEVLGDAAHWLAPLAERSGVEIRLQPCGGWVLADARRLRQIAANLLSNAIKFNHRGGTVWLGAQRHDRLAQATWRVGVRDDGPGLAPARQARLFRAFERLDAERDGIEGVGLGLVIVQQLAGLMGGAIDVVSAPGQGSEFGVSLPAAAAPAAGLPAASPAADEAPASADETTRFRVLYIEDNPVNVVLVEGLIALRPAVQLHAAVNGLSGVAMAIALRPEVVLVDMQLPDIDGVEVLRRLRADPGLAASRMVALSANGLSEDIAHALAEGFDDYWTKPIDFKLFLRRLDALMVAPPPPAQGASRSRIQAPPSRR